MSDFASAVMVRILAAGMRLHGMSLPPLPAAGARVTLAHKRGLVASALGQGGWACLPLLGRGVAAIRGDPVHQALVACGTVAGFFERWCRLERYIHSRHRVRMEAAPGSGLHVSHVSLHAGQPPLPAEDLVVLGVLAAALEEAGLGPLQVTMAGVPVYPLADPASLQRLVSAGQTAGWHFTWQGESPASHRLPAAVMPADDMLTGPPLARQLGRLALNDLMQVPALAHAARQLGMAPRSLQRQLAGQGLTYSGVVTQTRCRAAAWHLMRSAEGTASTGFVCGFSDQAHFTRVFRQQVGVPPARYRKEFGEAGAALFIT
jgi:AraC-like DNA-binding protein